MGLHQITESSINVVLYPLQRRIHVSVCLSRGRSQFERMCQKNTILGTKSHVIASPQPTYIFFYSIANQMVKDEDKILGAQYKFTLTDYNTCFSTTIRSIIQKFELKNNL